MAHALYKAHNVPTPDGIVIDSLDKLDEKLNNIDYPRVVKAQVQIGGRGKAGGIKFANSPDEAKKICKELLHSKLKGMDVNKLLIVQKANPIKECYLSIMLDRDYQKPVLIFSANGGIDIEQAAKDDPDSIIKIPINPLLGIQRYNIKYILKKSNLDLNLEERLFPVVKNLYELFIQRDCMLVEINPLAINGKNEFIALDGKITIDDSALPRQEQILNFREELNEEALVKEARKFKFLYIPIEEYGKVAVMSNGSGMIMSCIDLISKEGIKVGAVLDIGGGATADRVAEGIRIILSNKDIDLLFVNIFGGITRCDEIASGIKKAVESLSSKKTVIVRIEGTNKDKGMEIINTVKGIISVDNVREGVKAVVAKMEVI